MNRIGLSVCALVFFAALNSSCVAQENPWNGSWKMDASTMKYNGPTFTVTRDAEGFMVTRGGTASPKIVCDGKPKAADGGLMTTCTKNGDGYALESTKDGKQVNKVMISLSENGKMMTRKAEIFPSDDSPFTMTMTSKRISGGPGTSGVWKEVTFNESQDTGILSIKVDGDNVAFKETDNSKPVICKLDGSETKLSDTSTMAVKLDGPRTLKVTYRTDGKVRRENTFVLGSNGKTVKETDVTPEPSASTMSVMFHKG